MSNIGKMVQGSLLKDCQHHGPIQTHLSSGRARTWLPGKHEVISRLVYPEDPPCTVFPLFPLSFLFFYFLFSFLFTWFPKRDLATDKNPGSQSEDSDKQKEKS